MRDSLCVRVPAGGKFQRCSQSSGEVFSTQILKCGYLAFTSPNLKISAWDLHRKGERAFYCLQEEVFGGDIVLGLRIPPPPSCLTPQTEGSESPPPSDHHWNEYTSLWCEYGNGPSEPGRF